jgi:acetyl-CoA carboxylase biotin carboxyl carrier protein
MSNDLSSLTEEHVRQLARIIETLENSAFDFLQLEVGELKVTVGKGQALPETLAAPALNTASTAPPAPVASPPAQTAPAANASPAASPPPATRPEGTIEIKSPIIGMFYAQPEPGAPPFVSLGDMVQSDSTVGLIEVMKTYNAVTASQAGQVVEICVSDMQLVEYGQVLFRVLPE